MAELTISTEEIRGALERYVSSYSTDVSREEVGTVADTGDGIAHVDGDSTDVTIEAFYDRSSGEWLRLNYALGDVAGNPSWNLPIANR
jgi:F-type H+-transporting ATPase subunit alpha